MSITCLSKVHADFYRLSEDLDFIVPVDAGMGTFVQNVHNFLIRSSTSGFLPDVINRVTQELVTPKYRATSAPE
ncbi:MAG: nucleotidyl transferase AbiEii/AbiGii toxin family protein [Desulfobacterales bacterium]|nr:nucleotidyl transferase AbiEii/AbiGii toxin family protein [Desulfobacterales bacterium]